MHALEPLSKHATADEAVGAALAPTVILGIALGIASLKERWALARPTVALWTMGILFVSTCGRYGTRAAENQKARATMMSQLQTDSASIRHTRLGFELPHPGEGFAIDSARQEEVDSAAKAKMLVWVFTHETVPRALTLTVVDSLRRGENGFRNFASGVRKALRARASQVTEDTLSWHDGRGEFRAGYVTSDESIRMRCISYRTEPYQIRVVCAMTASLGDDSLAFVREGLRTRTQ